MSDAWCRKNSKHKILNPKQIKNQKIAIHLLPQVGTTGREFKMVGTKKNLEMPEKWSNQKKAFCSHWIYEFKYLDNGEIFSLEFDYNDNFVKKLTLSNER